MTYQGIIHPVTGLDPSKFQIPQYEQGLSPIVHALSWSGNPDRRSIEKVYCQSCKAEAETETHTADCLYYWWRRYKDLENQVKEINQESIKI